MRELDPQPGETILDFCAAPGGKTTFIAQLMNNEGQHRRAGHFAETAEIDPRKLRPPRRDLRRNRFALNPQLSTFNRFDRILVDAPCSNTGVMRRRVDLRWRISPEEIARLRDTQLDLLNQAAAQLKPGGVLVYSTCSLEPEENSEVVKQFLAPTRRISNWNPNANCCHLRTTWMALTLRA